MNKNSHEIAVEHINIQTKTYDHTQKDSNKNTDMKRQGQRLTETKKRIRVPE
jgi:hypothetical protein